MAEAKKYSLEELIALKKKEKLHRLAKNISGQKFNRLTVLFPIEGTGKGVYWACECECGNYIIARGDGLRKGTTKSCGCWNTEVRRQQFKHLNLEKVSWVIGQKFGKLTAIEFNGIHPTTQSRLVHCKCDCGNECDVIVSHLTSGHTQSCGCYKREQTHKTLAKDITGMRFGMLVALKPTEKRNRNNIYWDCVCDCGNHKDVIVANLLNGHTKSCGCTQKNDLTNQIFGELTVLYPTEKRASNGGIIWHCKCSCGNEKDIPGAYLLNGTTKSCGCLSISTESYVIWELLTKYSIQFETEKTFSGCKFIDTGYSARYDFWVENSYLIEYDGKQHYTGWWNDKNSLISIQEHDTYKNQWCRENNIPLIRIPYTKLDTLCIEDLMLETTQFRVV